MVTPDRITVVMPGAVTARFVQRRTSWSAETVKPTPEAGRPLTLPGHASFGPATVSSGRTMVSSVEETGSFRGADAAGVGVSSPWRAARSGLAKVSVAGKNPVPSVAFRTLRSVRAISTR